MMEDSEKSKKKDIKEEIENTAEVVIENDQFILGDSNAEKYDRFSPATKQLMIFLAAFACMQVPISTTSFLPCVPFIADTFHTDAEAITGTNGITSIFMTLSPLVWGPLTEIYGRKYPMLFCSVGFFITNVAVALSPNLPLFVVFRCVNALCGTSFFSMGASIAGDLYIPSERGTAMSWILLGSQLGPAVGPVLGGVVITYRSWRLLYWIQAAMAGLLIPAFLIFLKETAYHTLHHDLKIRHQKKFVWVWFNPFRVMWLFRYPNMILAGILSGSLMFNMYFLLTPISYVVNPRFNLTTPIYASLFYLAPASGYIMGSFLGGRWADRYVKLWMKKRGYRLPEDRIRSTLYVFCLVLPGTSLIYGWSIDKEVGGLALPIVALVFSGISQTIAFPSINTYCVDSMPRYGSDGISGNYAARYIAQGISTSTVLPILRAIGVGWTCTIAAFVLWFGFVCALLLVYYGAALRRWRDSKERPRDADNNEATNNNEKLKTEPLMLEDLDPHEDAESIIGISNTR